MRSQRAVIGASLAATVHSLSLSDVCTTSHVQSSLPASNSILGISPLSSSVVANPVYNYSSSAGDFFPASTFDYCNVTFSYTHIGRNDVVNLQYWLPAPSAYSKRYLATGGGGFAINSGTQSLPGGVMYGAVSGATDGGFGSFSTNLDAVVLLANGTINWEHIFMFGYQGIGEATQIGKALSANFYGLANGTKIYTYYQGCSEGGREGWSQVQRYPQEYDGVIPGAPAFRYAQQQVNHLYANVVEQTLNYYPPSCELDKIRNETIAFCDPLDGKSDGVVSRSDLCLLQFDPKTIIGKPYYCAATSSSGGFGKVKRQFPTAASEPEQNGTVSAQGVAVVQKIWDGLHNSKGERAYISYQLGAGFTDATTTYDNTTGTWGLDISSLGGEWVTKFLELVNATNLPNLDGVTYDTLVDWMKEGFNRYQDTLQTTIPDLTPYQSKGGKIIHFHGEQDDSIPAGSSVHYYESVRNIMYPNATFNASQEQIGDWYRLFLIPGAAHCSPNTLQANGPFPQTNLQVMINWVEKNVNPTTLNATVLSGTYEGQNQQLCAWPLRPLWNGNTTNPTCVYDQKSINTWMYDFNAYKLPLY